jgi:tRNA(Ile)-lysidine synthase
VPKQTHVGDVSSALLSSRVLRTMTRLGMVRPGERVLVGLSGGADSVALTELLVSLSRRFDPPLSLVLAHLNHGLRPDADEDERFCRETATRLALPFVSERVDVGALAAESKRSIEDEGRRTRYRFLLSQKQRWGCAKVAVGHTLDDQAETFLLRLLRGSGARGLGSVHPVVESRIIRPLIEVRHRELEEYLTSVGSPHREDVSNADLRFTRNRLRHRTLPELEREFNPRVVETLSKAADLFRDEDDWMEREAARVFETVAVRGEGMVRLDVASLAELHPALRRRLLRRAIETVRGDLSNIGLVHVEDVLSLLAAGRSGRRVHLPGLRAERSFGELRIRTSGDSRDSRRQNGLERGYNDFEYRLSIPARIPIPERGGVLSAELNAAVSSRAAVGDAVAVGVDAVGADWNELSELKIRSPRPGDRFRPLGAPGSKSLMRYLMDRKVDRERRRFVPVVVRVGSTGARGERGGEEILWVVGHGVSESSRLLQGRQILDLTWVRTQ